MPLNNIVYIHIYIIYAKKSMAMINYDGFY